MTTWRTLQRMGAALLTPGAAAVPYTEDLLEQTEWLAQRIVERRRRGLGVTGVGPERAR